MTMLLICLKKGGFLYLTFLSICLSLWMTEQCTCLLVFLLLLLLNHTYHLPSHQCSHKLHSQWLINRFPSPSSPLLPSPPQLSSFLARSQSFSVLTSSLTSLRFSHGLHPLWYERLRSRQDHSPVSRVRFPFPPFYPLLLYSLNSQSSYLSLLIHNHSPSWHHLHYDMRDSAQDRITFQSPE